MSGTPITLAELFRSSASEGPADRQVIVAQTGDNLRAQIADVPEVGWGPIEEEIGNSLDQLLDIRISDIFAGAWTKLQELQEYRDGKKHPPDETSIVPLHRHTIKSSHKPKIRIYSGQAEIATIEFSVDTQFEVATANLKVRGGRIVEVTAGEYKMSGKISLAGKTLMQKSTRAYQLPGHLSLGEGIEIPAL